MAGGWNHIVDEEGRFRGVKLLENDGDVKEALEEVYGMIWFLADQLAQSVAPGSTEAREVISLQIIEQARRHYTHGLEISPSTTYRRRT